MNYLQVKIINLTVLTIVSAFTYLQLAQQTNPLLELLYKYISKE